MVQFEVPPGFKLVHDQPLDRKITVKVTKSTHDRLSELAATLDERSPSTAVRWILEQPEVHEFIDDFITLSKQASDVAAAG